MSQARGPFISVEGIEGVGKSTAVRGICDFLEAQQVDYVLTREPGGTAIAEKIRHVLLSDHEEVMAADTELLLMFACRAQNIASVIKPALARGACVVSDRFTDASFAYQGGGRGIPIDHVEQLANWVHHDLWPDVTILLDAPVEVGIERMKERSGKDRIEKENIAFFERVRSQYLDCARRNEERFRIVDASRSLEAVQADIQAIVQAVL